MSTDSKRKFNNASKLEDYNLRNMMLSLSFPHLKRWFLKGGTAILDQGIFSGSNFILSLLLARWLDPSSYGAFAVAFTVYLFFTGFHNAIILEPISVLGPSNYSENLKGYLSAQYRLHFLITLPLGFLMVIVGWLVGMFSDTILGSGLVSIGFVLPFLLLIWLSRRISYLLHKPKAALIASSAYMTTLLLGMVYLHSFSDEMLPYWFLLMGLASLVGSVASQSVDSLDLITKHIPNIMNLMKEQWVFGRWVMFATIFYFIGSQIQIFVVVSSLGLDAAGAFRAVQNLTLPVFQVFAAISTLVFPLVAFEYGQKQFLLMKRKAIQVTLF